MEKLPCCRMIPTCICLYLCWTVMYPISFYNSFNIPHQLRVFQRLKTAIDDRTANRKEGYSNGKGNEGNKSKLTGFEPWTVRLSLTLRQAQLSGQSSLTR